ncbi:hypothetical protein [Nonomuraea sp. NPDC001699]
MRHEGDLLLIRQSFVLVRAWTANGVIGQEARAHVMQVERLSWFHASDTGDCGDGVDTAMASACAWRKLVRDRGSVERDREALAQLIEYDGDPFEIELYEHASDPQVRLIDRAVRSHVGQYNRRLRRLEERAQRT